jgi:methanogenic corrinoid protein MtbC1
MTQDEDALSRKGTDKRSAEINSLAKAAISVLARQAPPTSEGVARRLETLCEAYISPDEAHRLDALGKLASEGVSVEDIIDYVIPATARLMGHRWAADSLSFAEVSIGSARLQETVRGLTVKKRREVVKNQGSILMILPYREHHTLGAFVAADQLRRRGLDVHISVSQHPKEVAERIKRHRYDMIGVTAAGRRTLASVKDLVEIIRSNVSRRTPVILGGSILDSELDAVAITGADFAATDVDAALEYCGLGGQKPRPVKSPQGTERNDATENR